MNIDSITLLTLDQVAELGKVCKRTVEHWVYTKELQSVKFGKTRRVTAQAWHDFLTNPKREVHAKQKAA